MRANPLRELREKFFVFMIAIREATESANDASQSFGLLNLNLRRLLDSDRKLCAKREVKV